MIDYDPPFDIEFSADGEYWDNVKLPWNEDDEELNIELLLNSEHVF